MICDNPCNFEKTKQHSKSETLIENDEKVCRFGFFPMHYNMNGMVQKSLIKSSDLKRGKLSFWRLKTLNEQQNLKRLIDKISVNIPENQILKAIFCPFVLEIRAIANETGRVFCVIDDCATGDSGLFDVDHCVVQPCKVQFGENFELLNDANFQIIRNKLFDILEESSLQFEEN